MFKIIIKKQLKIYFVQHVLCFIGFKKVLMKMNLAKRTTKHI